MMDDKAIEAQIESWLNDEIGRFSHAPNNERDRFVMGQGMMIGYKNGFNRAIKLLRERCDPSGTDYEKHIELADYLEDNSPWKN